MTSDQIAGSIYMGLWLALVASSLALRRLPRSRMAGLAAGWLAIIAGLWALIVLARKLL